MNLSKTSEYAIRILSYMAHSEKELHSVSMILENIDIPQKYMRRLMTALCKHNFIHSIKGRDGGYKFLMDPKEIFLTDIIEAVDGLEQYFGCLLGFNECSNENPCAIHTSWVDTVEVLKATLKTTSLADVKNNKVAKF